MTLSRTVGHVGVLALLLLGACTSGPGKILGRSGNGTDTATTDPTIQPPTRSANDPSGGCVVCDESYACILPNAQTGSSSGFGSSSGDNGSSSGFGGGSTSSGSSSSSSGSTSGTVQSTLVLKTQADGTCGNGLLRFACGGQVLVGSLVVGTWTSTGTGFTLNTVTGELTCVPGGPIGIPQPGGGSSTSGGITSSSSTGGIRFPDAG